MKNGNTDTAIVIRKVFLFKNNRGANKGFMWLYPATVTAVTKKAQSSDFGSSPGNSTEVKPNFSKFRIRIGYSFPNK